MRKLLILAAIAASTLITSCTSCQSNQEHRLNGLRKTCPNCTMSYNSATNSYYATDTASNAVYRVEFCAGGPFSRFTADDVDRMTRIN